VNSIRASSQGRPGLGINQDVALGISLAQPLLVKHPQALLAEFDMETRVVAGQVFRRILMADEFLLRYLADVEKDQSERWADYLSERYLKPLNGHLESLRGRVPFSLSPSSSRY
jgi:hypothetical protein